MSSTMKSNSHASLATTRQSNRTTSWATLGQRNHFGGRATGNPRQHTSVKTGSNAIAMKYGSTLGRPTSGRARSPCQAMQQQHVQTRFFVNWRFTLFMCLARNGPSSVWTRNTRSIRHENNNQNRTRFWPYLRRTVWFFNKYGWIHAVATKQRGTTTQHEPRVRDENHVNATRRDNPLL